MREETNIFLGERFKTGWGLFIYESSRRNARQERWTRGRMYHMFWHKLKPGAFPGWKIQNGEELQTNKTDVERDGSDRGSENRTR